MSETEKSKDESQEPAGLKVNAYTEPAAKPEPLKVAYEARGFVGPNGEVISGRFPIDGSTPSFQGTAIVRAKPSGPMPELKFEFVFDIFGANTVEAALATFDAACQYNAPRAKQDAVKEWHRQYGTKGAVDGMQRQGLLDAMGNPIRHRMPGMK